MNKLKNMAKIKLFIMIILATSMKLTLGQAFLYPVGAPAMAMGLASVASSNFWSVYNNQAGAATAESFQTGVFFENPYLIPGMGHASIGVAVPLGKGNFFFHLDQSGAQLYAETRSGLGYAMRLANKLKAGIQLDHFLMHAGEGFGNFHALTFEGGVMADIIADLTLGLHVFNPLHMKWLHTEEHLPVIMRGGLSYKGIMDLTLSAEVQKSTDYPAMLCVGAEYNYRGIIYFRAGISSGPSRFTFGAGMRIKNIMLDLSSSMHEWLGYSPQISITYSRNR